MTALTINLCLPNSIRHTPQPGQHEEYGPVVRVRTPVYESHNDAEIDDSTRSEDGYTTHHFHHRTEVDGTQGVTHSVTDHHVAHHVHAQSARYICLSGIKRELYTMFTNFTDPSARE